MTQVLFELEGKERPDKPHQDYISRLQRDVARIDPTIDVVVYSGVGEYGSARHRPHDSTSTKGGGAEKTADVFFMRDGEIVPGNTQQHIDIVTGLLALGWDEIGIGMYRDGTPAGVHLGYDSPSAKAGAPNVWGYPGGSRAALNANYPNYVRSIQTTLKGLGYYDGPIDGVYGAQTSAAMQQVAQLRGEVGPTVAGERTNIPAELAAQPSLAPLPPQPTPKARPDPLAPTLFNPNSAYEIFEPSYFGQIGTPLPQARPAPPEQRVADAFDASSQMLDKGLTREQLDYRMFKNAPSAGGPARYTPGPAPLGELAALDASTAGAYPAVGPPAPRPAPPAQQVRAPNIAPPAPSAEDFARQMREQFPGGIIGRGIIGGIQDWANENVMGPVGEQLGRLADFLTPPQTDSTMPTPQPRPALNLSNTVAERAAQPSLAPPAATPPERLPTAGASPSSYPDRRIAQAVSDAGNTMGGVDQMLWGMPEPAGVPTLPMGNLAALSVAPAATPKPASAPYTPTTPSGGPGTFPAASPPDAPPVAQASAQYAPTMPMGGPGTFPAGGLPPAMGQKGDKELAPLPLPDLLPMPPATTVPQVPVAGVAPGIPRARPDPGLMTRVRAQPAVMKTQVQNLVNAISQSLPAAFGNPQGGAIAAGWNTPPTMNFGTGLRTTSPTGFNPDAWGAAITKAMPSIYANNNPMDYGGGVEGAIAANNAYQALKEQGFF